MKNHTGDLILITWQDACSSSAWMSVDEAVAWDTATIETAGWVVKQTKKRLTICGARGCDLESRTISNFSEATAIPIDWVQKIEVLKAKNIEVTK